MTARVSIHAKERFRQRTSLAKYKDMVQLFRQAKEHGKSYDYFAGEFYNFLAARKIDKNMKIKVFQNLIFFYKHHNLITVYAVPEEFLPTREHTRWWFRRNKIEDTARRTETHEMSELERLKYELIEGGDLLDGQD